jgi:hypothetical protein
MSGYTHNITMSTEEKIRVCDAQGCKVSEDLIRCFGGMFCSRHKKKLTSIRRGINHNPTNLEELQKSYNARQKECIFRKTYDDTHLYFLFLLEHQLKIRKKQPQPLQVK